MRHHGKAAEQLAITQPAVSKAISDIEHTLKVRLLDRTAHGVEPTVYGRSLLKWSNAVFDDLRQGVREIEYPVRPDRWRIAHRLYGADEHGG